LYDVIGEPPVAGVTHEIDTSPDERLATTEPGIEGREAEASMAERDQETPAEDSMPI
jgi:hypothetical protein